MAKAKLVAAAERKARQAEKRKPLGKTLVAVFTEKDKQVRKKEKKAMMTTKNIVKEPEKKAAPAVEATTLPAVAPAPDKPEHPPKPESKNARIERILISARDRLRGRGMPELDTEMDELIEEVKSWPK